jgi:hypothetical protein
MSTSIRARFSDAGVQARVVTLQGKGGDHMLWLILGVVLLIIAIAGGAIVHPVLFALAIVALAMFVMRWRYA